MKRTKYELYKDSSISHSDLFTIKEAFSIEELKLMNEHMSKILGSLIFKSFESKCFAEKSFEFGYLAAHAERQEAENERR